MILWPRKCQIKVKKRKEKNYERYYNPNWRAGTCHAGPAH